MYKLIFICFSPILFQLYQDLKEKKELNFMRYVYSIILAVVVFLFMAEKCHAQEPRLSYPECYIEKPIRKPFTQQEFETVAAKRDYYKYQADMHFDAAKTEIQRICSSIVDEIGKVAFFTYFLSKTTSGAAFVYSLAAAYGYEWTFYFSDISLHLATAHYYYSVVEWIDECKEIDQYNPFPGDDPQYRFLDHTWNNNTYCGWNSAFWDHFYYDWANYSIIRRAESY